MEIRRGGLADAPAVLGMMDQAVAWLAANGRSGQWGSQPWSSTRRGMERITAIARDDTLWIAEVDGGPAGAMATSPVPPTYVPAADEPELYVTLLVTARSAAGLGVGGALLGHARRQAERSGVHLLRVDCYAGGGGGLVDYYRRNGFTSVEEFSVGDWPGCLLSQRV